MSTIIVDGSGVWSVVHIDDAVAATVAAITAEPETYNVMDDDPLPVSEWLPAFARWVDAPVPPRMSVADALAVAGEEAVFYHMTLTGASNAHAQAKLGFTPRRLLWAKTARCSSRPPRTHASLCHRPPGRGRIAGCQGEPGTRTRD